MTDYTETELEAALRRAFVDNKADYIIIDSRRDKFLIESSQLGMRNGWLSEKFKELDEQSGCLEYRLTTDGKKHFGVK